MGFQISRQFKVRKVENKQQKSALQFGFLTLLLTVDSRRGLGQSFSIALLLLYYKGKDIASLNDGNVTKVKIPLCFVRPWSKAM